MNKWNVPGAMSAVLAPHWDDRNCTTLSCRMVAHPPENPFEACGDATFTLRLMPE